MKKTKRKPWLALAAGTAATVACGMNVHAQSSDALIDKLVDKGILTVKEANALRDEADKNFASAYQVKSGMPEWVTSMKLNGDLRGRYESIMADQIVDRHRFRYRFRLGATAVMMDDFEVAVRLGSGETAKGVSDTSQGDPISNNTTFGGNASKKPVFLDLAYAKWTPIHDHTWNAAFSLGKMENPFLLSDMVFDGDYTPEGLGQQFSYNLSPKHTLKLNLGEFVLGELGNSNEDPFLFGAQLRWDANWNKRWQTTVGVAGLDITDARRLNATATTFSVPNQNGGNLRSALGLAGVAGGSLQSNYNPVVMDAYATYNLDSFPMYTGAFPIRFGGDYINNPGAHTANQGYNLGVMFGKSGKKGLWDLSYRYKALEGDAWYEEISDSDFGAVYQTQPAAAYTRAAGFGTPGYIAGTNVRGHVIKANYSPYDSMTVGLTFFLTEVIDEPNPNSPQTMRLQLDAVWKF